MIPAGMAVIADWQRPNIVNGVQHADKWDALPAFADIVGAVSGELIGRCGDVYIWDSDGDAVVVTVLRPGRWLAVLVQRAGAIPECLEWLRGG